MHVAVLGGGVVGVATAYFLGADGHEVTLIDGARHVGSDASAGNAGLLAPNDAYSWASPEVPAALARSLLGEPTGLRVRPGLDPDQYRWGARFLLECTPARAHRASVTQMRLAAYGDLIHREIDRAESLDYSLVRRGVFYLYRDARRLDGALRRSEVFGTHGIEQRRLSMAEVCDLEPGLGAARGVFAGAIYGVGDASGDCATFTRALADRCVERFGTRVVLDTQVSGLVGTGDRAVAVRTSAGDIDADAFVLALGVGSPRVARTLGVRLPIYPLKGYSATFPVRDPSAVPTIPAVEQSTLIAYSRFGGRIRMSSTAELAGYDRTWKPADFATIRALAREILPGADIDGGSYRACLRPMTPDGPPILGVGRHRNVVYNTGHGHLGWTLAAGSGRVAADLVAGRRPAVDLTGMHPRGWLR